MPYVKNTMYCDMPFSSETPKGEFYSFHTVPQLVQRSETHKDEFLVCRTIGIFHSTETRFYLTDLDTPTLKSDRPTIRISAAYLKHPLKCTTKPSPVQIFGMLQWRNRPVIFAKIVQPITPAMAIRIRDTYSAVTSIHLAKKLPVHTNDCDDDNSTLNT